MDNNTFSPVAQEPVKKSSSAKVIIAALIALLIGAGATAAVFLITGNNKSQPGTEQTASKSNASPSPVAPKEDEEEKKSDIPTSGEITNARLVEELATKTNRILGNEASANRNAQLDAANTIDAYKNLSTSDKAMIVINELFSQKRMVNTADIPDGYKIKEESQKAGYKELYVIDINDYAVSDYQYLFGYDKEPDWAAETVNDRVSGCTHYYVKEKKLYVSIWGCGGTRDVATFDYQYKYTYDGDKAYVYVALASVKEEYVANKGNKYTIYSGLYGDNKTMSLSDDQANTYGTGLKYDMDEYYKDFAHYRVVFEKDSTGNYAYKTIEEVKD